LLLNSAIARLRAFFLSHIGEDLTTYQLNGVSGIQESPRRIRELRVDHGMAITSGPGHGLSSGEYRLEHVDVGPAAAARLKLRSDIRATEGSSKDRCLLLLKILFPSSAGYEDLSSVSSTQHWKEDVLKLQTDGWDVVFFTSDPNMPRNSCRLATLEKGNSRSRAVIDKRMEILRRDSFSCSECGSRPQSNRASLQLHRLRRPHSSTPDPSTDFVTLCLSCHCAVHSEDGVFLTSDELLQPSEDPWSTS